MEAALIAAGAVILAPFTRKISESLFELVTRPLFFGMGWIIGLAALIVQKALGRRRRQKWHGVQ